MLRRLLAFSMFFIVPILIFGQSVNYNKIILDFCKRAENLDWKGSSINEIVLENQKLTLQIIQDHQETIVQIKDSIKTRNPKMLNKEIEKEFTIGLLVSLVNKCDTFVQLTRTLLAPCPKENETLKLITQKVDSIIDQNQNLSYPEQLKVADNQLFNLIMDNESQVDKDYKDGFADPKLPDDLGIYLLHNSIKYYKAYLVTESIKMLN